MRNFREVPSFGGEAVPRSNVISFALIAMTNLRSKRPSCPDRFGVF